MTRRSTDLINLLAALNSKDTDNAIALLHKMDSAQLRQPIPPKDTTAAERTRANSREKHFDNVLHRAIENCIHEKNILLLIYTILEKAPGLRFVLDKNDKTPVERILGYRLENNLKCALFLLLARHGDHGAGRNDLGIHLGNGVPISDMSHGNQAIAQIKTSTLPGKRHTSFRPTARLHTAAVSLVKKQTLTPVEHYTLHALLAAEPITRDVFNDGLVESIQDPAALALVNRFRGFQAGKEALPEGLKALEKIDADQYSKLSADADNSATKNHYIDKITAVINEIVLKLGTDFTTTALLFSQLMRDASHSQTASYKASRGLEPSKTTRRIERINTLFIHIAMQCHQNGVTDPKHVPAIFELCKQLVERDKADHKTLGVLQDNPSIKAAYIEHVFSKIYTFLDGDHNPAAAWKGIPGLSNNQKESIIASVLRLLANTSETVRYHVGFGSTATTCEKVLTSTADALSALDRDHSRHGLVSGLTLFGEAAKAQASGVAAYQAVAPKLR